MANPSTDISVKPNGAVRDFRKTGGASESLESMSHDLGERAGSLVRNVSHSVSEYSRASRDYVKENPAKGIAIAAVTGAVLGSIFTLSMRRRG